MKIVIDTELLKKDNINLGLYLDVLKYYFEVPYNDISNYVVDTPNGEIINHLGIELIEKYLLKSELGENKVSRFDALADKLREIFPKGKKPGTSYMWRGSTAVISKKLQALVKATKIEFTDEEAIRATERYVKDKSNDPTMRLLTYFISKNDNGEFKSEFLDYLSNDDEVSNDDWQTELK